jgi:hypothetical protein
MKNYSEFHDGFLDGVLITPERGLDVYLRTRPGKRARVFLSGVVAASLTEFREGNIILEVLVREGAEITLQDVARIYGLAPEHEVERWEEDLVGRASDSRLVLLEVNPSFGASCMVLAEKADFHNVQ